METLIKSKRAYQKLSDSGEIFARSQAFSKKTQAYAQLYFRKFLVSLPPISVFLYIQILNVLAVFLYKLSPGLYLVAHQLGKYIVG